MITCSNFWLVQKKCMLDIMTILSMQSKPFLANQQIFTKIRARKCRQTDRLISHYEIHYIFSYNCATANLVWHSRIILWSCITTRENFITSLILIFKNNSVCFAGEWTIYFYINCLWYFLLILTFCWSTATHLKIKIENSSTWKGLFFPSEWDNINSSWVIFVFSLYVCWC